MKSRARKPNNQDKSITAGNRVHFVRNKAAKSNDIAYAWARPLAGIIKWMWRKQFQWAGRLITVTPQLADWVAGQGVKTPCDVVPNGANTDLFHYYVGILVHDEGARAGQPVVPGLELEVGPLGPERREAEAAEAGAAAPAGGAAAADGAAIRPLLPGGHLP